MITRNSKKSSRKKCLRLSNRFLFVNNDEVLLQGSYNFNMGDNVDLGIVNSRNYSIGGQIGFCAKRIFDFNLFFTYDLKPAYNQEYIYGNMPDFYNTYVDHLNKRWRFGTSMVIYIPFSNER